jgi:3-hydroxyacyl-CoA dehydrogenase / enoyl-CoA hydratase / 3-hydroxybutyryl-CoA epimerase
MNDATRAGHWRLEERDGALILTLDAVDQNANVLSAAVLQELDQQLADIEGREAKGLIIRSGKRNGFIVGADVYEFQKISDSARAAELARAGQLVFNRLEKLKMPTVAVIHGNCLGGGLEMALACTYRVAREDEGTRLGLPEVRLGIHPGFGGTVRLPPLIGHFAALDLMLTGRTVGSRAAKRLGLVDETVPERHLLNAALALLNKKKKRHRRRKAKLLQRLPGWWPWRKLTARIVGKQLHKKVNPDHYPSPYRMVELWRKRAGQEDEALSLGELLVSRTSRNLVHIFLLGEDCKRGGRREQHDIRYVHVVGAGVMGADIAMWAAFKGFQVSLQDTRADALGRAVNKAHGFYKKKLKAPHAAQEAMDRLMPDLNGHGLHRADLVIEAIVENAEAKRGLFKKIDAVVRPDALLATNTSSIPLEELAPALKDPARLVGLHFFNPVPQMQLVEIVRGAQTGDTALARARAFTVALDRLPLDVKSSPGFLVNRVLMPYLIEAMLLVEEGLPMEGVDRAATDFGMPMGPVLLADTVGLDICLSVAEELSGPLGIRVPARLREMVERGELGRKSGKGFYQYDAKGKPRLAHPTVRTDVPITERLILRMLDEAVACLREKVVADADAVDTGMVYGTGFAPYLGGPMRYAETLGETGICSTLERLAREYGERFKPDAGWGSSGLLARRELTRG